ncbi:hypothetical protein [Lactovum odontotermitis]
MNIQKIEEANLEGKKVKIVTKEGREITDTVYYQGDLDWEKLNDNLGIISIGYSYLALENHESKIKLDDISSIEILNDTTE